MKVAEITSVPGGLLTASGRFLEPQAPVNGQVSAEDSAKSAGRQESIQKGGADPVPVALELGWTMALLFTPSPKSLLRRDDRLPTEHELPPGKRSKLEADRAKSLLGRLGKLLPKLPNGNSKPPQFPASLRPDELRKLNLAILTWLACAGREFSLAYQLGRSLRDTANPPLRLIEITVEDGRVAVWRAEAEQAIDDFAGYVTEARDERKTYLSQQALPVFDRLSTGQSLTRQEQVKVREGLREASRPLAQFDAVKSQLSRGRVTKLQEWLVTLSSRLPPDSAALVGVSIGRWCDLVTTIYDPATPGRLRGSKVPVLPFFPQDLTKSLNSYPSGVEVAGELYDSLLPQGDAWLNLLTGAQSAQGLLTPEAYVAAGEAALGRSVRIIRRIAAHYWVALLILLMILGGVIYVAYKDLSGASKLWTQIAAVAGALGVTARGFGTRMAKLSEGAETSVFSAEKTDAMAWAITSIPRNLKLDAQGIKALRRSGIRPPGPLGRA
jgi:hypothetical protein